jgi:hypothetical protein
VGQFAAGAFARLQEQVQDGAKASARHHRRSLGVTRMCAVFPSSMQQNFFIFFALPRPACTLSGRARVLLPCGWCCF